MRAGKLPWLLAFALALTATLADPFLEVWHEIPSVMAPGLSDIFDPMEVVRGNLRTSLESERSGYVDFDSDGDSNHYDLVGKSDRLTFGLSGVFSGPSGPDDSNSLGSEVEEVKDGGLGLSDISDSPLGSNRGIERLERMEKAEAVEATATGSDLADLERDIPATATSIRYEQVNEPRGSKEKAWSGLATFYHPSLAGNIMRDGVTRYDPEAIGPIASISYPLGTWLDICGPSGRCIMGVVSDTGLLPPGDVDVSEAMFRVLAGSLDRGRVMVSIALVQRP